MLVLVAGYNISCSVEGGDVGTFRMDVTVPTKYININNNVTKHKAEGTKG